MSHDSIMPHLSNVNDRQSSGLLMTHSSTRNPSIPSINIRSFNFNNRTMEQNRIYLPNNVSTTIEDIPPVIEDVHIDTGISSSSLLNIERLQSPSNTTPHSSDNCIINVEDPPTNDIISHDALHHDNHHHQTTVTDNLLNNIREAANVVVGESQTRNNTVDYDNNNNTEEDSREAIEISPEARAIIRAFRKVIPFISLLLAKGLYDHRTGILNFILLLIIFNHANNVVKREIAKQQKSWSSLFIVPCYIVACIVSINYEYDTHIFSPNTQPLTILELLWSVLITDFVLKLITVVCKVFLTCLPVKILALRKRGKYYLLVEATSQLYRCVAPVQPWLYYFFEAYQGPEKILGVFFSVLYTVSKGNDLLSHLKLFHAAICKLIQNVNFGVPPTKEQLIASGGICAICHEEYTTPVRLHCKHIFCETCVLTWIDRERSCPLCRTKITDDPIYRDGHTTHYIQLY